MAEMQVAHANTRQNPVARAAHNYRQWRQRRAVESLLHESLRSTPANYEAPPDCPKLRAGWEDVFGATTALDKQEAFESAMAKYADLSPKQQARVRELMATKLNAPNYCPFERSDKLGQIFIIAEFFEQVAQSLPVDEEGHKINTELKTPMHVLHLVALDDRHYKGTEMQQAVKQACINALWELEFPYAEFWYDVLENRQFRDPIITKMLETPLGETVRIEEHVWSVLRDKLREVGPAIAANISPRKFDFFEYYLMFGEEQDRLAILNLLRQVTEPVPVKLDRTLKDVAPTSKDVGDAVLNYTLLVANRRLLANTLGERIKGIAVLREVGEAGEELVADNLLNSQVDHHARLRAVTMLWNGNYGSESFWSRLLQAESTSAPLTLKLLNEPAHRHLDGWALLRTQFAHCAFSIVNSSSARKLEFLQDMSARDQTSALHVVASLAYWPTPAELQSFLSTITREYPALSGAITQLRVIFSCREMLSSAANWQFQAAEQLLAQYKGGATHLYHLLQMAGLEMRVVFLAPGCGIQVSAEVLDNPDDATALQIATGRHVQRQRAFATLHAMLEAGIEIPGVRISDVQRPTVPIPIQNSGLSLEDLLYSPPQDTHTPIRLVPADGIFGDAMLGYLASVPARFARRIINEARQAQETPLPSPGIFGDAMLGYLASVPARFARRIINEARQAQETPLPSPWWDTTPVDLKFGITSSSVLSGNSSDVVFGSRTVQYVTDELYILGSQSWQALVKASRATANASVKLAKATHTAASVFVGKITDAAREERKALEEQTLPPTYLSSFLQLDDPSTGINPLSQAPVGAVLLGETRNLFRNALHSISASVRNARDYVKVFWGW